MVQTLSATSDGSRIRRRAAALARAARPVCTVAVVLAAFDATSLRAEPSAAEAERFPGTLTYVEPCTVARPVVDLGGADVRERVADIGIPIPDSGDLSNWSDLQLISVAHVVWEWGNGTARRAAAKRLLCLAVRRGRDPYASAFLALMYADVHGSPAAAERARHFARVAATRLSLDEWRAHRPWIPVPQLAHEHRIDDLLTDARAWLDRIARQEAPARFRTALTYAHGVDVPRSDHLADALLRDLRGESARYALFWCARAVRRYPHLLARDSFLREELVSELRWLAAIQENPDAQRQVALLYLRGLVLPFDPARAYVWLRNAELGGAHLDVDPQNLYARLTPQQRALAERLLASKQLPDLRVDTQAEDDRL
jgi:hypothetical protein